MTDRPHRKDEGRSAETVAGYWSSDDAVRAFSRATYWLGNPLVQQRYHAKATAGRHPHWVDGTILEFLDDRRPVSRLLSIGCGDGLLERHLMTGGAAEEIDAIDLAPARIARAREAAAAEGFETIRYFVRNAETEAFPQPDYDVVIFDSSLHHIQNLEAVLDRVSASLGKNGLLVLNEYVGPRRFALSEREKQVIQACFDLLPARFRRSLEQSTEGQLLPEAAIPTPVEVERVDPSEAIRSDEILTIVESRFEVLERRDLGGTILNFLLANIAGNFGDEDPISRALLETFFTIEDTLIMEGDLTSHFVFLVAKNRKSQGK